MKLMRIEFLTIAGLMVVVPNRFDDDRGFFSETYNYRELRKFGLDTEFVQDNHSFSKRTSTIRGLHFQPPPFAQDKLVRVSRGKILDVVVDLRPNSPTYKKWESVILSADNWKQLFIPKGFAHGFLTLAPDTEVCYKVSNYYNKEADLGVFWADPDIGIEWGIANDKVILSDKDQNLPFFSQIPEYFTIIETTS